MRTLQAGALYFTIVFCAGFVLGTLRTLWVAPRIGNRAAELPEAPFMLVFTVIAARSVIRFLAMPVTLSDRLVMGCVALGLMLIAELAIALWLRKLSPSEYIASRDPISGPVYCTLLVGFAIMPTLLK